MVSKRVLCENEAKCRRERNVIKNVNVMKSRIKLSLSSAEKGCQSPIKTKEEQLTS